MISIVLLLKAEGKPLMQLQIEVGDTSMDKEYLSTQLAEALGIAHGIVEAEHKLLNDENLVFGMKRQLQEIHDEDEKHVKNLERALDAVGRGDNIEKSIEHGRKVCHQLIEMSGDDPIEMVKATILAKYRLADSQELFYNICDVVGHTDICELFEENLEEEEDHLDYLREQAMLMAHSRITGESITNE